MNKKIGIVKDNRYFNHVIKNRTPENPDRIRQLYRTLETPQYNGSLAYYLPREAPHEQILEIHSRFYLDQIRELCLADDPYVYDKDTYLMDESLYTTSLAVGGCMELVDRIMSGEIDYGFALVRPPGHHAEPGRGMGFCIVNNIAITASYLRNHYGLNRILVLDLDVHHGNGTQEAFYDSNEVLVVSIHQHNLFPFSGKVRELGSEKGIGYTINLPVFPQFGDVEYTSLINKVINPVIEQYLPQIILVSAGFDGHEEDSISDTLLTTSWFSTASMMLRKYAADCCDGRLLFVLEGGYNPVSLESSVLAVIDALMKPSIDRVGVAPAKRAEQLIEDHLAKHYWTF